MYVVQSVDTTPLQKLWNWRCWTMLPTQLSRYLKKPSLHRSSYESVYLRPLLFSAVFLRPLLFCFCACMTCTKAPSLVVRPDRSTATYLNLGQALATLS